MVGCIAAVAAKQDVPSSSTYSLDKPNLTLDDVVVSSELKNCLRDWVACVKGEDHKTNLVGAKPPRGILLHGSPGNGKSTIARALAGELGSRFFILESAQLQASFLGLGAKNVKEAFENAKRNAPSVIFIDEIDILTDREKSGYRTHQDTQATLTTLLTELDGVKDNHDVFVLAATNRPNALDKALTRPGRLGLMFEILNPDQAGCCVILQAELKKNGTLLAECVTDEALEAKAGDLAAAGLSGAEVADVAQRAKQCAQRSGASVVSLQDVVNAATAAIEAKATRTSLQGQRKSRELGAPMLVLERTAATVLP